MLTPKSLFSPTPLVFNCPDGGVPIGSTISVKFFTWMSTDGQRTKWRRNIADNFNLSSSVHERYRQTTDRRQTDGRWHIANVDVSSRSLIVQFLSDSVGLHVYTCTRVGDLPYRTEAINVNEWLLCTAFPTVGVYRLTHTASVENCLARDLRKRNVLDCSSDTTCSTSPSKTPTVTTTSPRSSGPAY